MDEIFGSGTAKGAQRGGSPFSMFSDDDRSTTVDETLRRMIYQRGQPEWIPSSRIQTDPNARSSRDTNAESREFARQMHSKSAFLLGGADDEDEIEMRLARKDKQTMTMLSCAFVGMCFITIFLLLVRPTRN